jgi:hypothetical protein
MTSVKASRARHLVISGETYGIDDVKKLYVRVGILLKGGNVSISKKEILENHN